MMEVDHVEGPRQDTPSVSQNSDNGLEIFIKDWTTKRCLLNKVYCCPKLELYPLQQTETNLLTRSSVTTVSSSWGGTQLQVSMKEV